MFCPGDKLPCGGGVGWGLVSGADTDLSPVRAGDDGVTTPLCIAESAVFTFILFSVLSFKIININNLFKY